MHIPYHNMIDRTFVSLHRLLTQERHVLFGGEGLLETVDVIAQENLLFTIKHSQRRRNKPTHIAIHLHQFVARIAFGHEQVVITPDPHCKSMNAQQNYVPLSL